MFNHLRSAAYNKGITLIEIIVALSIVAIVASIVLFSLTDFKKKQALEKSRSLIVSAISEARSKSVSSVNMSDYGIHIETNQLVLYKGSYVAGGAGNKEYNLDIDTQISSILLSGGSSDVLFKRLTGEASQSGTIIVSLKNDSTQNKTITIYSTGLIESN
jgi:prepilin-type N-terminal cleavage/methylation domain-containing protein